MTEGAWNFYFLIFFNFIFYIITLFFSQFTSLLQVNTCFWNELMEIYRINKVSKYYISFQRICVGVLSPTYYTLILWLDEYLQDREFSQYIQFIAARKFFPLAYQLILYCKYQNLGDLNDFMLTQFFLHPSGSARRCFIQKFKEAGRILPDVTFSQL